MRFGLYARYVPRKARRRKAGTWLGRHGTSEGRPKMVDPVSGRVSFSGSPVYKATEPECANPCIVRKATPEELAEIEEKLAKRPWKPNLRKVRQCQMADIETAVRRRRGVVDNGGRWKRFANKSKFIEMAKGGATTAELAEHFGIDAAEVQQLAEQYFLIRTLANNDGKSDAPVKKETKKRGRKPKEKPAAPEPEPEPALEPELGMEPEVEPVVYPQAKEPNEYRYIQPKWLDAVARGLTGGAVEHPNETWRTIPPVEHAWRAVRHLVMWLSGDRSDAHLGNASMRCMMSFATDIDAGRKEEG